MKIRHFILSIFLFFFGYCSSTVDEFIYKPQASITYWKQGEVASAALLARNEFFRRKQAKMPIWVRIAFDKPADDVFINDYFRFLKKFDSLRDINPLKHGKFTDQFVFKVNFDVKKDEIEDILNQADECFNAEIKRLEQAAIAKKNKEIIRQELECKERKRKAEIEKKLKEEVLNKETEERLNKEREEFIKKATAEAEKAAKVVAETERLRILSEKEIEVKLAKGLIDIYSEINLPLDFHISGMHCLNDHGQVAGYVGSTTWEKVPQRRNPIAKHSERAALWDANHGIKLFPLTEYYSKASSINDYGWVAVESYSAQDPRYVAGATNEVSRVILWNTVTDELKYGPIGIPIAISNNNVVLIKLYQAGHHFIIWNSEDNLVMTFQTDSGNTLLGLNDDGTPYSGTSCLSSEFYSDSRINSIQNNVMWFYDGKNHFLSPYDGNQIISRGACGKYLSPDKVRLNKRKDELVAITSSGAISKWRKNGKTTKTLPKTTHADDVIWGFSNSGKILLGFEKYPNKPNFRLLTPLNK